MFEIKYKINEEKLAEKKEKKLKISLLDFSGGLYFFDKDYLCKTITTGKPISFGHWLLYDIWSLTQAYLEYPKNTNK